MDIQKRTLIEEILTHSHVDVIKPEMQDKPIYRECHIVAASARQLATVICSTLDEITN